jgi:hypothetical protein
MPIDNDGFKINQTQLFSEDFFLQDSTTHICPTALEAIGEPYECLSKTQLNSKEDLENAITIALRKSMHVVAPHGLVARLFESQTPNQLTFEFNVPDYDGLQTWAMAQGLSVDYLSGTEKHPFRPFHFRCVPASNRSRTAM